MRKIRMAQIGTSRHSHGREIFATFASMSDIFEIVGYALPENERVLVPERMYVFEGYREMSVEEILNDPTIEAVSVETEEKYLTKWHDELLMSEEMIALAYEYCIIQTAKLSFPYMDKIITRWSKEGITTITAAEEDNRKFKNRAKREETAFGDNSYDHDDLEKLTRG